MPTMESLPVALQPDVFGAVGGREHDGAQEDGESCRGSSSLFPVVGFWCGVSEQIVHV